MSLNESCIDLAPTPGTGTSFLIGVGDETAAVHAQHGHTSGAAHATSNHGGIGSVLPFEPAGYPFSVSTVPGPASAAMPGTGSFGLGPIRRRRGAGRVRKGKALAA